MRGPGGGGLATNPVAVVALAVVVIALAGCTGAAGSTTTSTVPADPSSPVATDLPVEPAATLVETAATPADSATATSSIELGQGVTLSGLTDVPTRVRRVDTLDHQPGDRADFVAELSFGDGSVLRVVLGRDATDSRPRQPTTVNGQPGWQSDPPIGEILASLGWNVGADTWLRIEAVGTDAGRGLETLRTLSASITYDPAGDARVTPVADEPSREPLCSSDVAISGGGPDMVLFTCDGVLAIYSGETGRRLEELVELPDALVETGAGPLPAVTGLATSADGATVYYSVGHAATSRVFRYTRGSGQPPVELASGWGPAVAPDGSVAVIGTGSGAELTIIGAATSRGVPLYGMPIRSLAWSADSTQLAFATRSGVIGVLDAATLDVELYASTTPGYVYGEPWLEQRGLTAFGHCCAGAPGEPIDFLVVGAPGNNADLESTAGGVVGPARRVVSTNRAVMTRLHGERLGPPADPWATGVLEAALLPSVSVAAVDLSGALTD